MPTEIDKMTDDELRIAVAEAKGYVWTEHFPKVRVLSRPPYEPQSAREARRVARLPVATNPCSGLPDWLTSMDAAWELVAEMQTAAWAVKIDAMWDEDGNNATFARAFNIENAEHEIESGAPSTPERSIVIVYLKWKQQEHEGI